MANQISRDGVAELQKNIKNPLVSIFDKFQASGKLSFEDIRDEFDWMMKFVKDVDEWQDSSSDEPTVIVNNKVYKPSEV